MFFDRMAMRYTWVFDGVGYWVKPKCWGIGSGPPSLWPSGLV